MNWFFNSCTRHRQNLCLLASGVLPAPARDAAEQHLTACPSCRTYYAEIQAMTTTLAKLPHAQAPLEPNPAARQRWAQAVQSADLSPHQQRPVLLSRGNRFSLSPGERAGVRAGFFSPASIPFMERANHFPNTFSALCQNGLSIFRNWCRDVLWPYRRIWTGLAAVWIILLVSHLALRDSAAAPALAAKPMPAQTLLMAFKDRQTTLDELLANPSAPVEAERRKPFVPKPRTENATIAAT